MCYKNKKSEAALKNTGLMFLQYKSSSVNEGCNTYMVIKHEKIKVLSILTWARNNHQYWGHIQLVYSYLDIPVCNFFVMDRTVTVKLFKKIVVILFLSRLHHKTKFGINKMYFRNDQYIYPTNIC